MNKCFMCPYNRCYKEYASKLAMELHMRKKHHAGCKKDRDFLAVNSIYILEADDEMLVVRQSCPQSNIQLPPGYIEVRHVLSRNTRSDC